MNIKSDINTLLQKYNKKRKLNKEQSEREKISFKKLFTQCDYEHLIYFKEMFDKGFLSQKETDFLCYELYMVNRYPPYSFYNNSEKNQKKVFFETAKLYFRKYGESRLNIERRKSHENNGDQNPDM